MNSNKIILIIGFIALFLLICLPTTITIKQNHIQKQYKALELKIQEAAKKCVMEDKCNRDEKIFIKVLKENNYVNDLLNPKTKKQVSNNSYVILKDNKYEFILAED